MSDIKLANSKFGFYKGLNIFAMKVVERASQNSNRVRSILYSSVFSEYLETLDKKTVAKFNFVFDIVETTKNIPPKFVKQIKSSIFYEIRVDIGNNAYRSIVFSINNKDFRLSDKIIILNAFLKKSEKDSNKFILRAENILKNTNYGKQ